MFPPNDIYVMRDDLTLIVSRRDVMEGRKHLRGWPGEAVVSRAYLRVERIKAVRSGSRAPGGERQRIRHRPQSMSAHF
jgi:hypothetical protein